MEPPGGVPSDKDKQLVVHQQPNLSLLKSAKHQPQQQQPQQHSALIGISVGSQQTIEKLSRPMAFDKMESLVREMQDPEHGVPVRQQKMFLTSIPYAFMGYDLIEWLMDRLMIEESEALNIANQLCLHGYFFPVNDSKTLVVKDDSSLYRFQTPYYWPWQHKAPDNVEYAIYLAKRSLRNKQRHALEDYESEALASLHKNLKGKWDFIAMQADEQVRLAKERKKGDKIVGDSQERAFWRVHRPPPGQFTPLEPCPVPSRDRTGIKSKKKTVEDWQREVDYLQKSLTRTRMKMSQACESLVSYSETFADYEFFLQPVLPSNPWVSEDIAFWQLNNAIVDIPTEKRVRRWAISIEELVSDPTGLNEFTVFLEKEYSHENIRFWIAVNRLRRSAHSQVSKKVIEIYEEFLKPGAPCEINIDGKTMEIVQRGLKNPSRFTFDAAAEHIYMLLLKKDCYPRFIRSEHYKNLLATGIQPLHKKRFFNFGGVGVKKKATVNTATLSSQAHASGASCSNAPVPLPGHLTRRRGSDRSLSGSVHELAVIGIKDPSSKVPHSHSQSNLCEIAYREGSKPVVDKMETTMESASAICPWDDNEANQNPTATFHLSVCPWEQEDTQPIKTTPKRLPSTSSDISEVSDRMRRSCGLRQNTVDSSEYSTKRLMPNFTEQRRASVTLTPRISEFARSLKATSLTVPIYTEDVTFTAASAETKDSPKIDDEEDSVVMDKPSDADTTILPPNETITSVVTLDEENKITPEDNPDDEIQDVNNSQTEVQIELIQMETISDSSDIALTTADIPEPMEKSDETPEMPKPEIENAKPDSTAPEIDITASTSKMAFEEIQNATNSCKIAKSVSSNWPAREPAPCASNSAASNLEKTPSIQIDTPMDSKEQEPHLAQNLEAEMFDIANCPDPIQADIPIELPSNATLSQASSALCLVQASAIEPNAAVSPMELKEEEMCDEEALLQEELSPTTDEYHEGLQFEGRTESYEYDIDDVITPGCVAPAPTPAPSLAPLAEIDMDPVEDEIEHPPKKPDAEESKKKRKKHSSETRKSEERATTSSEVAAAAQAKPEGDADHKTVCPWEDDCTNNFNSDAEESKKKRKKHSSETRKSEERATTSSEVAAAAQAKPEGDADHKTVCPWEDEDVTSSDTTFVKTYATLGYL